MNEHDYISLVMAALMGSAIGLEREFRFEERSSAPNAVSNLEFAGIRTFALSAILGFVASFLSGFFAGNFQVIASAIFIGLAFAGILGLTIVAYIRDKHSPGITSEVAFFITFFIGVLCQKNQMLPAGFITVLTVMILSAKATLQKWMKNISGEELKSAIKFSIITVIILPILPSELKVSEGLKNMVPGFPWELFSPHEVWVVVVLVSGIGFLGYILVKTLGSKRGLILTGFSGGLVSSTAVTLDFSKRANRLNDHYALSAGILIACVIMFPRMLLEAAVFHAPLVGELAWPIGGLMLGGFMGVLVLLFLGRKGSHESDSEINLSSPLSLKDGLLFGGLYLVIHLTAWAGEKYFGSWGIYAVGILSGLSDVDAITISMARAAASGTELKQAAITVYLAGVSNTITKMILVMVLSNRRFVKITVPAFLGMLAMGFLFLWGSLL